MFGQVFWVVMSGQVKFGGGQDLHRWEKAPQAVGMANVIQKENSDDGKQTNVARVLYLTLM